ncbi:MAG: glucohydrolase, partial [Betaproteobacteria bacterium HGW-Betaproteobacteria-21]
VAQQDADPDSVLNYHRRLIALRKAEPVLVHGRYALLMEDDPQIYAYTRSLGEARIVVIANLSGETARYTHDEFELRHGGLLLANHAVELHPPTDTLALLPYEARVYRID